MRIATQFLSMIFLKKFIIDATRIKAIWIICQGTKGKK